MELPRKHTRQHNDNIYTSRLKTSCIYYAGDYNRY